MCTTQYSIKSITAYQLTQVKEEAETFL